MSGMTILIFCTSLMYLIFSLLIPPDMQGMSLKK